MLIEAFSERLPGLYERFPHSLTPRDRRFKLLLQCIPGLSSENVLALLNLAAGLVDTEETYLEIGSFKGLSLVAAMLGNDASFVAIDDFSQPGSSAAELRAYLEEIGLSRATVIEGNAVELLRTDALYGRRVKVCYLDSSHEYRDQIETLELLEPHMAEEALLIVDDADWDQVAAACNYYLARSTCAKPVLSLPGSRYGAPQWWQGVRVLGYLRSTG